MDRIYTIDEIRAKVKPVAERYGIDTVWLFGSYARGEAAANSDVDLLVKYKSGLGLKFIGFVCDLEDDLGIHVDVLTHDGLYLSPERSSKASLIKNIEKDMRAIYEEQ